jgi:hypothetical protein
MWCGHGGGSGQAEKVAGWPPRTGCGRTGCTPRLGSSGTARCGSIREHAEVEQARLIVAPDRRGPSIRSPSAAARPPRSGEPAQPRVHLIVSRVGLEDADIKQVIGYGMDDVGVIDDATFTRRAEAARAGFLPP